jgi:hypothetical protein
MSGVGLGRGKSDGPAPPAGRHGPPAPAIETLFAPRAGTAGAGRSGRTTIVGSLERMNGSCDLNSLADIEAACQRSP